MVSVREAQIHELKEIIELIKKMNDDELRYLRYNVDHVKFVRRIGDNILNGTFLLFIQSEVIIGFLEYSLRGDGTLWIYSLYFIKEYRKYVFTTVTPVFNKLKKHYKTDIYFTVQPDNRAMKMVNHLIKAKKVRSYPDGRIEYVVKGDN